MALHQLTPTYVKVAASQTAAKLSDKRGSFLKRLIIQPLTTSPGTVILYDGKGSTPVTVYTFPAGSTAAADLHPVVIEFELHCTAKTADLGTTPAEGWYLTTGTNVAVVAVVQTF
jgi:hypothetical protein